MLPKFAPKNILRFLIGLFLFSIILLSGTTAAQENSGNEKVDNLINLVKTCVGEEDLIRTGEAFKEVNKRYTPLVTARLLELFNTKEKINFSCSVNIFGRIGKTALPALVEELKANKKEKPRRYIMNAIADIAENSAEDLPELKQAVPVLMEILEARKDSIQYLAGIVSPANVDATDTRGEDRSSRTA